MKRFKPTDKNIKNIIELDSKGINTETVAEIIGASAATVRFYSNAHRAVISGDVEELKQLARTNKNPKGIQKVCEICNYPSDFLEEPESPKEEQLTIVAEPITDPILYELKCINAKLGVLISLLQTR